MLKAAKLTKRGPTDLPVDGKFCSSMTFRALKDEALPRFARCCERKKMAVWKVHLKKCQPLHWEVVWASQFSDSPLVPAVLKTVECSAN